MAFLRDLFIDFPDRRILRSGLFQFCPLQEGIEDLDDLLVFVGEGIPEHIPSTVNPAAYLLPLISILFPGLLQKESRIPAR